MMKNIEFAVSCSSLGTKAKAVNIVVGRHRQHKYRYLGKEASLILTKCSGKSEDAYIPS